MSKHKKTGIENLGPPLVEFPTDKEIYVDFAYNSNLYAWHQFTMSIKDGQVKIWVEPLV